jgi:hypothetical protein
MGLDREDPADLVQGGLAPPDSNSFLHHYLLADGILLDSNALFTQFVPQRPGWDVFRNR